MAAAAAAVRAGDPGVNTKDLAVRYAWYNLGAARFVELCDVGYTNGDSSYVAHAIVKE